MINYLCTYCLKEIREAADCAEDLVSHGICYDCLSREMARYGQALEAFLDTFREPVFVVDEHNDILGANKVARRRVNGGLLTLSKSLHYPPVFGCLHLDNAAGCEEGIQCLSCTIRSTVKETYETGIACSRIPACNDLRALDGDRKVEFFITTEKIGESVFLHLQRNTVIEPAV